MIDVETGKIEASSARRYQGNFKKFTETVLPELVIELTGDSSIRRIETRDSRPNLPLWTSVGLGVGAGIFAGLFYFQGAQKMDAYNAAPRGADFEALRSEVKSADIRAGLTLSAAVILFGSAGFFFWHGKHQINVVHP
jgi:hypothetical protein